MSHFNLTIYKLAGSVLTLSCIVLTACSDGKLDPLADGKVDAPENWGVFEHTHIDFTSQTAKKECPLEERGVFYIDPIPKLVELARDHNVVMINEAHYKPRNGRAAQ